MRKYEDVQGYLHYQRTGGMKVYEPEAYHEEEDEEDGAEATSPP